MDRPPKSVLYDEWRDIVYYVINEEDENRSYLIPEGGDGNEKRS